jgi:hypothetical protein
MVQLKFNGVFVDCILQQYREFLKRITHSATTSGRYCTIFLNQTANLATHPSIIPIVTENQETLIPVRLIAYI